MIARPPTPTLFPYTTLFRSRKIQTQTAIDEYSYSQTNGAIELATYLNGQFQSGMIGTVSNHRFQIYTSNSGPVMTCRSEEHTSELQSLRQIVCRLLLEKKKY